LYDWYNATATAPDSDGTMIDLQREMFGLMMMTM